jgi:hypothetical protein
MADFPMNEVLELTSKTWESDGDGRAIVLSLAAIHEAITELSGDVRALARAVSAVEPF